MYRGWTKPARNIKKAAISAFPARKLGRAIKVKYLSKWCSNPLALTIYVNANELHSLPIHRQPLAQLPRINVGQSFHLRGQEICVCRNGWVIFSSKRKSSHQSSWNKRIRFRKSRAAAWGLRW
jgi:hypothetical protein